MHIPILYEDKDLLVINKPAGLIVHADGKTEEPTLVDWLLEKYPEIKDVGEPMEVKSHKVHKVSKAEGEEKDFQLSTFNFTTIPRPGIVHRIDRETSGCLIIAKNQETFLFLKKQFQERTIAKTYKAIVWGSVKKDEGIIDVPIGRSKNDFRQWSAQRGARGEMREAITEYKVLKRFEKDGEQFSLVEVSPKTGRTHQIRVHFKYLNYPIVCDSLYAPNRACPLGFSRLALHAAEIKFTHPNGSKMNIEAPLPEDFNHVLKND